MQSAAGFAVFSRMCSDPLKMSPQIVQKVLIFFLSTQNLKGAASVFLSQSFLEQFPFIFSPFTEEITELYNRRFFFPRGNKLFGSWGQGHFAEGDTKEEKGSEVHPGSFWLQGLLEASSLH